MLILHLGAEAGRLEQALRRPTASAAISPGVAGMDATSTRSHSFRNATSFDASATSLMCVDEPVVLGVEDLMDRGQSDVLVAAAVAGDEVRVEELVVVRDLAAAIIRGDGVSGDAVVIAPERCSCPVWPDCPSVS